MELISIGPTNVNIIHYGMTTAKDASLMIFAKCKVLSLMRLLTSEIDKPLIADMKPIILVCLQEGPEAHPARLKIETSSTVRLLPCLGFSLQRRILSN